MAKRKSATDIACGVAKVESDALGATLHAEKSAQGVVLSKNAAFRCGLGLVERPNKQSRQRVDTKHLEI
mgnify:CR=1 FL=1